jgi:hypothetical protein
VIRAARTWISARAGAAAIRQAASIAERPVLPRTIVRPRIRDV